MCMRQNAMNRHAHPANLFYSRGGAARPPRFASLSEVCSPFLRPAVPDGPERKEDAAELNPSSNAAENLTQIPPGFAAMLQSDLRDQCAFPPGFDMVAELWAGGGFTP